MQGSLCKGPPTYCRGPYLDYLSPLIRLGPINGLLPKAEAICIALANYDPNYFFIFIQGMGPASQHG